MIEVGLGGLVIFACYAVLCTFSGIALASRLPWQKGSPTILPVAFGVALGPFLLGFAAIFSLTVAGGQAGAFHLWITGLVLALPIFLLRRGAIWSGPAQEPFSFADHVLGAALFLVAVALLFISVFTPLTQNDALEYLSAARAVYENNWIGSYPVLEPLTNSDGFYGPWTHPPLYVAMLYLVDVLQGHSEAPGLARLIAPWFALAGAFVVFGLSRGLGRAVALGAALVFLSTPLLFLGAASALLDPLPISGFALLLVAIVFLGGDTRGRGVCVGLVLGLCLWTHSLAILYVPLALVGIVVTRGIRHWRIWAHESVVALTTGLLAGGAHYVRNTFLFGAPISDNPLVFAVTRLAWDEYFIINRGLDSVTATFQYGVLKGWFAFEAFGFSFWGMAVGGAALVLALRRNLIRTVVNGSGAINQGQHLLVVLLGILITYYAGVILSVLLGIDLMVKNERYLLSIQALVAIFCGFGYFALAGRIARFAGRLGPLVRSAAALTLGVALVGQTGLFVQYGLSKNNLSFSELGRDFQQTLGQVPDYQLIEYLRTQTPADAVVFSLKPSDMYYAQRRQIGYLDPRLVPVYEAAGAEEALILLKDLGVSYIHVPSYGLPPLYNSPVIEIMRDRRATTLRYSNAGGQIYELTPSAPASEQRTDITPGAVTWSREALFELGGRKRLSSVGSSNLTALDGNTSVAQSPLGLFQRSLLTLIRTGGPDLPSGAVAVRGGSELGVDLQLSGRGLMTLIVVEYPGVEGLPRSTPLGTFELSDTYPSLAYSRRILLDPATTSVSVVLQQQGQSTLTVDTATVTEYTGSETTP